MNEFFCELLHKKYRDIIPVKSRFRCGYDEHKFCSKCECYRPRQPVGMCIFCCETLPLSLYEKNICYDCRYIKKKNDKR